MTKVFEQLLADEAAEVKALPDGRTWNAGGWFEVSQTFSLSMELSDSVTYCCFSLLELPGTSKISPIGLYRDVWIAAIASSRMSLATLTVVMCNTSQCKLRSSRVNSGMLNVICIVLDCNGVFAIKAYSLCETLYSFQNPFCYLLSTFIAVSFLMYSVLIVARNPRQNILFLSSFHS